MLESAPKRVLFAGYAPVHFLCFQPVYERLTADPRVEVYLSGGFRHGPKEARFYSIDGFYDPFDIDRDKVLGLEDAREQDFDVLVCSHLSNALFPRSSAAKVQIFHGVSFKNLAVREKALRYDTLCLPGNYHAMQYVSNGLVRPGGTRYLITGFPKADRLVSGNLERERCIRRHGLDSTLPTILFAPTGTKGNALESMGAEVIQQLAECNDYNVLIKPHDHPKRTIDWFRELAPLENERVRLVRDLDVVPYLNAADLLMTDASSVAVEYTLLDRPIVFLDCPRLLDRIRKISPAMDLDTYGRKIGQVVGHTKDLRRTVDDCLTHPERGSEFRREMARDIFHQPGKAASITTDVVLHSAGLAPSLPDAANEVIPPGIASATRADRMKIG